MKNSVSKKRGRGGKVAGRIGTEGKKFCPERREGGAV